MCDEVTALKHTIQELEKVMYHNEYNMIFPFQDRSVDKTIMSKTPVLSNRSLEMTTLLNDSKKQE